MNVPWSLGGWVSGLKGGPKLPTSILGHPPVTRLEKKAFPLVRGFVVGQNPDKAALALGGAVFPAHVPIC